MGGNEGRDVTELAKSCFIYLFVDCVKGELSFKFLVGKSSSSSEILKVFFSTGYGVFKGILLNLLGELINNYENIAVEEKAGRRCD
ncbi:Uncharacterised protein [Chlamydia trachomatis]|nr:Uncharacterised protein [Chlamydia trachomatis]